MVHDAGVGDTRHAAGVAPTVPAIRARKGIRATGGGAVALLRESIEDAVLVLARPPGGLVEAEVLNRVSARAFTHGLAGARGSEIRGRRRLLTRAPVLARDAGIVVTRISVGTRSAGSSTGNRTIRFTQIAAIPQAIARVAVRFDNGVQFGCHVSVRTDTARGGHVTTTVCAAGLGPARAARRSSASAGHLGSACAAHRSSTGACHPASARATVSCGSAASAPITLR
jgi:hypothetical protein